MAGYQEKLTDEFYEKIGPDERGYKYYVIPKGTVIYRGDTQLYLDNEETGFVKGQDLLDSMIPVYFAKEMGVAKKYGIVFEFVVKREYRLLAIDDRDTIQKLYEDVADKSPRLLNVLEVNYGHKTGVRLTDMEDDKVLVKWLCENGFQGYAANQMPSTKEGTVMIHRELVICDPSNIEFIKIHKDEGDVSNIIMEHKMRKLTTQQRKSRSSNKKRKSLSTGVKSIRFMKFDDEEEDDEVKKVLFESPNKQSIKKTLFHDDDDMDGGRRKTCRKGRKRSIRRVRKTVIRRKKC